MDTSVFFGAVDMQEEPRRRLVALHSPPRISCIGFVCSQHPSFGSGSGGGRKAVHSPSQQGGPSMDTAQLN